MRYEEAACDIAQRAVDSGLAELDLREFVDTPAGGFTDGSIIPVDSVEQVAASLLRWFRPQVAFERARREIDSVSPGSALAGMRKTGDVTCSVCGQVFQGRLNPTHKGRRFCSNRCKQQAKNAKKL